MCQPSCLFDFSGCVAKPVCGNGVVEINEECDDGALNSDTVPDACRSTNCKRAFCGDGVVDLFEDCEGNNLSGETCKTLGYDGGSLKCDPVYCEFDDRTLRRGRVSVRRPDRGLRRARRRWIALARARCRRRACRADRYRRRLPHTS